MYSTSVSSKIVFEGNNEPRLEKLDINVNGYNKEKDLKQHKKYYTKDEFGEELAFYTNNWRVPLWHTMFYEMIDRFKKWRYRRV